MFAPQRYRWAAAISKRQEPSLIHISRGVHATNPIARADRPGISPIRLAVPKVTSRTMPGGSISVRAVGMQRQFRLVEHPDAVIAGPEWQNGLGSVNCPDLAFVINRYRGSVCGRFI